MSGHPSSSAAAPRGRLTASRLSAATAGLSYPLAVVDVDAFDANASALVGLAGGLPIRVATKSLRCRPLIERALAREGFAGLMCYSAREAIWWARPGQRDVPGHVGLRVAVDVDASLRVGPAHLGVRRSPTRTPADVEAVIRRAQGHGLVVVGLMFYDAQIAGLPDSGPAVRRVKKLSAKELLARRGEVVAAARALSDLEIVNGGGTGSLHVTGRDASLT